MATRKHNEYLEASASGDDDSTGEGYNSEAEDLRKGGRNPKRRKVEDQDENGSDGSGSSDEEPDQVAEFEETATSGGKGLRDGKTRSVTTADPLESAIFQGISKPLTKKNLVATSTAIKRSGVVYLSRIPPFMKHTKLRSLLEPYGKINRIFMTPEDPVSHARRVRNGGNKKRSFTDGWVEFVKKEDAKRACELLNAKTIGGKKGTYYHDDVWNLLYLKGFKWNNLTEQIAAENAERASRMRAEISKTTRENKVFVRNVERAKMLDGIRSKRAAKKKKDGNEVSADKDVLEDGQRIQKFKQNRLAPKMTDKEPPQEVKRVLSKIF